MRTYRGMAHDLGITTYCAGECGINLRSHRRGFVDPFDVIHFGERRFTRRGAKRFLMLVAKRQRHVDPSYINDERIYGWWYAYHDSVEAQRLAGQLGFRIPSRLFAAERARCLWLATKNNWRLPPKVRAWATG